MTGLAGTATADSAHDPAVEPGVYRIRGVPPSAGRGVLLAFVRSGGGTAGLSGAESSVT